MITHRVEKGLNDQLNQELAASYSYLAMSAHLESTVFGGFANWMRVQAAEERDHAMKVYRYLADRGGRITLRALDQPKGDYDSIEELFEAALAQERSTTSQINRLYETALDDKDYTTMEFLGWFLTEQVEEENVAENMVERIRLADGQSNSLLRLDYEAGKREG